MSDLNFHAQNIFFLSLFLLNIRLGKDFNSGFPNKQTVISFTKKWVKFLILVLRESTKLKYLGTCWQSNFKTVIEPI